jgi:hypothetical protein
MWRGPSGYFRTGVRSAISAFMFGLSPEHANKVTSAWFARLTKESWSPAHSFACKKDLLPPVFSFETG